MPLRRTRHVEIALVQAAAEICIDDLVDGAAESRQDTDPVPAETTLQLAGEAGADHLIDRQAYELLARLTAHHVIHAVGDSAGVHVDDPISSRYVENWRDPAAAVWDRDSH